ncbi:retrovirus-related Pol polyprotein from transposon 17.6 [Trichonephila clavipes]|nr:retrovirus-related Pol polyprotein from transposon 17.6 [Trichonephila clavipes]
MVEVASINISLTQPSPSLSVRTAISPTLTEEFIIHPSVYTEIKKISHAKSDVLLNESESSLGAYSIFTVANVIENTSYDLSHVKNFNIRNDLSSLIKNYKPNKIKSPKLKMSIILKDDIPVCQRARRLSCSEKLQVNDQIDDWLQQGIIRESCSDHCSPIVLYKKRKKAYHPCLFRLFCMFQTLLWSPGEKKEISTAADSVRSGWPLWNRLWSRHPIESLNETKHAVFARRRS